MISLRGRSAALARAVRGILPGFLALLICSGGAGVVVADPGATGAPGNKIEDTAAEEATTPWPELPEPGAEDASGMLVNATNASAFKPFLIPELFPELRSGSLVIEAVKNLRYQPGYGAEWDANSREVDAGAKVGVVKADFARPGFIFGDKTVLEKERDKRVLAQKILWNINSVFWAQKIISTDFDLLRLREGKQTRRIGGNLTRVYPLAVSAEAKGLQLFRERLKFREPQFLEDMSLLTFRFLSAEDDILWVFSPLLKKVRQLTGSNRADPILDSMLSLDDFFGLSDKIEMFDAVVDSELEVLVPFADLDPAVMKDLESGCSGFNKQDLWGGADAAQNWNIASQRFPGGAPWLPTHSVYVPRKVWRIDLTSRDPFSLYGRIILYVDMDTMLPVYRIVYDRAGHHWKNIVAGYGFAAAPDKVSWRAFNAYLISEDIAKNEATIMDNTGFRFCGAYTEGIDLASFDPSRLGGVPATPTPTKANTEKAPRKPAASVQ